MLRVMEKMMQANPKFIDDKEKKFVFKINLNRF